MSDKSNIFFKYCFSFEDGQMVTFTINLHPETLCYIQPENVIKPRWTELDYRPCENCPKLQNNNTHCPIAVNIAPIVEAFKQTYSYDVADILVETNSRSYLKKQTSIQQGLSSLLGLIMPTSGCKDLDKLRPLVKYHLPFASIEETIYRAASMYLLGQYFRHEKGKTADWSLRDLTTIYNNIDKINRNLVKRLQNATHKDASLNAVVILDTFAQMLPMSIEETLTDLERLYSAYIS